MTPMHENELRHELASIPQETSADQRALTDAVIRRGRTVKRNRAIAGGVAAVALLASAIGLGGALLPGRDAVPAQSITPTPTTSATPSVQPTGSTPPSATPSATASPTATGGGETTAPPPVWTDPTNLPDDVGDLQGRSLPHEGVPGKDEVGPWETTPQPIYCDQEPITLETLTTIVGGRTIMSTGPVSVDSESVLVFASEADASAFISDLRARIADCIDSGPYLQDLDGMDYKSSFGLTELTGLGQEAFTFESWTEIRPTGEQEWNPGTGATLHYWAREGNVVAMSMLAGEMIQASFEEDGVKEPLRTTITQILG